MSGGLRTLLWVGIGALSVQLAATSMLACNGPEQPTLMPAAGGALQHLGVQFSRADAQRFLGVYHQLFEELDASTTVHVVVGDGADQELFQRAHHDWQLTDGPAVEYVVADRPITSWMRDRLAVLDGPTLLAPPAPMTGPQERANDWYVPWIVAERAELPAKPTVRTARFQFEGGDLISDAEHVFVVPALHERNPTTATADLLAQIAEDTGLDVVNLGTDSAVPDHHIGMFITPLGDGRVAYGDPDLGLAAIGDRTELTAGRHTVVVDRSEQRLERFRQVGRELRAAGFETVPVPIVPAAERYVMFSYNNALLERRDGTLHVFMPSYGAPDLDRAATRAWTDAGAVVHPIDVADVFRLGGSVRCLTAPLVRAK